MKVAVLPAALVLLMRVRPMASWLAYTTMMNSMNSGQRRDSAAWCRACHSRKDRAPLLNSPNNPKTIAPTWRPPPGSRPMSEMNKASISATKAVPATARCSTELRSRLRSGCIDSETNSRPTSAPAMVADPAKKSW